MKWKGETEKMKEQRLLDAGTTRFAFFPRQMNDGTWVWLERYYCTFRISCYGLELDRRYSIE